MAIAFGNGRPASAETGRDRAAVAFLAGEQPDRRMPGGAEAERAFTVSLTVDYGDGVRKVFHSLAWKHEMTVLDALRQADEHARGIELDFSGDGATAFIKRIDDLANGKDLPGDKGKGYWQFRVNGEKSKRGAGSMVLQAADEVVWYFGPSDHPKGEDAGRSAPAKVPPTGH